MSLEKIVIEAAKRQPDAIAIRAPDGALTYRELSALADRGARVLSRLGVRQGDRVAVLLEKSGRAVAAMQAVLRVGAAYVPLDVFAPPARNRSILRDGAIGVVITSPAIAAEMGELDGVTIVAPDFPAVDFFELPALSLAPDDLAYVLYTSGSTGTPKGVCISHRNALAFIEWAAQELALEPKDRLANHAPFFFDLSVFDLYAAFLSGASVSIIPEAAAYDPRRLVELIRKDEISVWYSVPSALILMMEHGGFLDAPSPTLRAVIFAGEPFPLRALRRMRQHFPRLRLLNFYGPTETNVCTRYEVDEIAPDRTEPVPIGTACAGDRAWLKPLDGEAAASQSPAEPHQVGELIVEGPTVMLGYWGAPPHVGPYATGDICRQLPDGNFEYLGRRDNMVKVRGHRIELGEIETALQSHPLIDQAAVIVAGSGMTAKLIAYAVAQEPVSLVALKLHCADRLPKYMIIDEARFLAELPRTPNGKIDRTALKRLVQSGER